MAGENLTHTGHIKGGSIYTMIAACQQNGG